MLLIIIGAVIIILLAALFFISSYLFKTAVIRAEQPKETESDAVWKKFHGQMEAGKQWLKAHQAERVEINSHDGLTLAGIYVPCEQARGTMVLMHGYRSLANVDFAPQAEFLHGLGYNLILPYQRSHGESEGKHITFGVKERYDCQRWAQYALKRHGEKKPIFLAGISMGASTVLMAAGLELPQNVKGIIADCGFTSPWEILKHVLSRDYHLPSFPFLYIANMISKATADFDFRETSVAEAMRENKIPVLFIHGKDDDFVPPRMTRENFRACKAPKRLLLVNGAAHAVSYLEDTPVYEKEVREFIQECLGR